MFKLGTELKVGITALAGILLVVYMSFRVNNRPLLGDEGNSYKVYFDNASGLVTKTPILISGIRVGYVAEIKLVKGIALVTIKGLDPDIEIYDDSIVKIIDKGILGEKLAEIELGKNKQKRIPDGGFIPNSISTSALDRLFNQMGQIAEVFPKLQRIADNIERLTERLVGLMDENTGGGAIERSISNDEEITQTMKTTATNIQQLVGTSNVRIDKIAEHLQKFSEDLVKISDQNLSNVKEIIDNLKIVSESIRELTAKSDSDIRRATESIQTSLESVEKIVKKVEDGKGTVGKLINEPDIADKLDKTIDGLNSFMDTFNRMQTSISYRGEFLYDSKDIQSIVGLKFQPRPDKYFLFEFVDEPVGDTLVTETTLTIDDGTPIKSKTVTRDDQFTLSIQFAKRLYDLNVRFGLMRSEGGFGADYYLLG